MYLTLKTSLLLQNLKKLSKLENDAVLHGYAESYEYCQQNFKYEPWNCPKPQAVKDAKHPISFTDIYKHGKLLV